MGSNIASTLTYAAVVVFSTLAALMLEVFVMVGAANSKPSDVKPFLIGIPAAWGVSLILSIVLLVVGWRWIAVATASLPLAAVAGLILVVLVISGMS